MILGNETIPEKHKQISLQNLAEKPPLFIKVPSFLLYFIQRPNHPSLMFTNDTL